MTPHDHHGQGSDHGSHHHHSQDHHGHSHGRRLDSQKAILWAFLLNLVFAFIELAGGWYANSISVLSDSIHDFGDALALGVALILERVSARQADHQYSYGYRRWSLVSALWTGGVLMAGTVWIWVESVGRLMAPEPVKNDVMLYLAFFGIAVNGYSWYRMSRGKSVNEDMLSWHFIEDLLGWILVLVVAIMLFFVDWPWLDSVLAMGLSLWISYNVAKRFLNVGELFLQKTPRGLEISKIEAWILKVTGVAGVHHTHVWSVDGQDHILTSHILLTDIGWAQIARAKAEIKRGLKEQFQISDATLEFESPNESCDDPVHSN